MKKYAKLVIAVLLIASAYLLYTYMLFDHKPFDDLKAGEIASARFILDGGHISITNLGDLPDAVNDIKLEKRAYNINSDLQKGQVTVELSFNDGGSTTFTIDNSYVTNEKGTFSADSEENAEFLKWAFKHILFDAETLEKSNPYNVDKLVAMAVEGKATEEISGFARSQLIMDGFYEDVLNSFENRGYSPLHIYALSDLNRNHLISQTLELKGDTENKALVKRIWQNYKNGKYSDILPPEDFVYGDTPDWDNIEFQQNENGYTYVNIPSADNKYNMLILFDKAKYTYALDKVSYTPPRFRFVTYTFGSAAGIPADYPAVDVIKSGNALTSATILTEKITFSMSTSSTPENPAFGKGMFICLLNNIDNKDFCYYNIFPLMPDRNSKQFKAINMEKVMRQVFGDYEWDAKKNFFKDTYFNEKSQSYEFCTDFGWGVLFYSAKNIISSFSADGKQVYSDFDMDGPDFSIVDDPAHKSYGRYKAVYDIVTENGETFLRFNRYTKI